MALELKQKISQVLAYMFETSFHLCSLEPAQSELLVGREQNQN